MIKTTKEIRDDFYRILKQTRLVAECERAGGQLLRRERATDATTQDVVIAIPANENVGNNIQEAVVYVRVYVQDIRDKKGRQMIMNEPVLSELEALASEDLERLYGDDWRAEMESQTEIKVEGQDQHAAVFRYVYRANND